MPVPRAKLRDGTADNERADMYIYIYVYIYIYIEPGPGRPIEIYFASLVPRMIVSFECISR